MRRSIDEAKKFYFKKRQLEDPEADLSAFQRGAPSLAKGLSTRKKIAEITIVRCSNLRRGDMDVQNEATEALLMQPFFSFDFFTFEYRSATASGDNPSFSVTKRYEVDFT